MWMQLPEEDRSGQLACECRDLHKTEKDSKLMSACICRDKIHSVGKFVQMPSEDRDAFAMKMQVPFKGQNEAVCIGVHRFQSHGAVSLWVQENT